MTNSVIVIKDLPTALGKITLCHVEGDLETAIGVAQCLGAFADSVESFPALLQELTDQVLDREKRLGRPPCGSLHRLLETLDPQRSESLLAAV